MVLDGQNETGAVKMHLQFPAGDFFYAMNYTCTGPTPIPPGTFNLGDAEPTDLVLGGIQPGSGYQCTFMGTDSNGDLCNGATTLFTVSAGQVAAADVVIACTVPSDAAIVEDAHPASLGIDADVNVISEGPDGPVCPSITAVSAVPSEIIGTQPSQLTVSESGPIGLAADGGPTTSNISWTTTCASPPCGTFTPGGATSNASNPSFTCGSTVEVVTIMAQITNYETNFSTGVTSDVCAGKPFTTMQATVNCEGIGPPGCFVVGGAREVACGDAGTCTNINGTPIDPNNCGGCGVTCAADGGMPVCAHNASTNANSCEPPPPGGP
jgi:hypothetical protein